MVRSWLKRRVQHVRAVLDQQLCVRCVDFVASGKDERSLGCHAPVEEVAFREVGERHFLRRGEWRASNAADMSRHLEHSTVVMQRQLPVDGHDVSFADFEAVLHEKKAALPVLLLKGEVAVLADQGDGSRAAEISDDLDSPWAQRSRVLRFRAEGGEGRRGDQERQCLCVYESHSGYDSKSSIHCQCRIDYTLV